MKKRYPIYQVLAYVFNPKKVENDNGHDLVILFESNDMDEAFTFLDKVEITDNVPEARLDMDDGENVDTLYTKNEEGLFATY